MTYHIIFNGSGLLDYCENETIVDWIAVQLPKMVKQMVKVNCLEDKNG